MGGFVQKYIRAQENYHELDNYLWEKGVQSLFLVCGSTVKLLPIGRYFETMESRTGIRVVLFDKFSPNPFYESVVEGVNLFRRNHCDTIVAVGGGSAMDVAKCIKLFSNMNPKLHYLEQKIVPNSVRLLAIPTTAGTGSEATRYAVIYYKGEKQSIVDDSCIPEAVLMDGSLLKTLPIYQKKSAMLDALCHGLEAFWSINSTQESREYSVMAVKLILSNMDSYLNGEEKAAENMLTAAHIAGKAINIAQTTAGHAMCYKLTSIFGISHGHAAGLCVQELWPWMQSHMDRCIDPRGKVYLQQVFERIECLVSAEKFQNIVNSLELEVPHLTKTDFEILKSSVNRQRLKNNPVELTDMDLDCLYHKIMKKGLLE